MRLIDGRRSRRAVHIETWRAIREPSGIWTIVDSEGNNPLRHVDPVRRLDNIHLAAKAPELKSMVAEISQYLRDHEGVGDPYFVSKLVACASVLLWETRPLYIDVVRAAEGRAQVNIDFAGDEAA